MYSRLIGAIFVVGLSTCSALYESSSNVVDLTASNFDRRVLESDEVWVVEFFAPWCGHCQSLVPDYKKAASALKGVVKVGAVNADEHKSLAGQFGIRGFPTIKIFGGDKKKPQDFNGQRTAQGIVDAAIKAAKDKIDSQFGGGGKKSGGGSGSGKKSDDVVELTDSNFDKLVLQSEDMWLVEFYAPWCGHCKNLAPHWASAATELKGQMKLGALDATTHTVIAGKYGIQGFPTIKFFGAGKKDWDSAEEYDGGRTSADIVTWAQNKLVDSLPASEIVQVTSQSVLKKACDDHPLCIIAILPHILDCQSDCRNNYISILKQLGEKYKKNRWGWVWAEGAAQLEMEDSLGIGGFGYPAMAAVNSRKMKFSILRGSFSYDGINEFLRELSFGRGSTAPVKGNSLPKIVDTEPWDGKDGKLEVEEEEYDDKDEL